MKINIGSKEIVHFIGIGGIGMSGLAQIMNNMGFVVQGSDISKNKNTERLLKLGISLYALNKNKEACSTFAKLNKEFTKLSLSISSRANTYKEKLDCK